MLDAIAIAGRTITADALLTQRDLAQYLVEKRGANYHFTVKKNQPTLLEDLTLYFQSAPASPNFTDTGHGEHGRIETRKIWVTTSLNDYLDFPYVRQAFMVERASIDKKAGKTRCEVIYGMTSTPADQADPEAVLKDNRGHWGWKAATTSSTGIMMKTADRSEQALDLKILPDCGDLQSVCLKPGSQRKQFQKR